MRRRPRRALRAQRGRAGGRLVPAAPQAVQPAHVRAGVPVQLHGQVRRPGQAARDRRPDRRRPRDREGAPVRRAALPQVRPAPRVQDRRGARLRLQDAHRPGGRLGGAARQGGAQPLPGPVRRLPRHLRLGALRRRDARLPRGAARGPEEARRGADRDQQDLVGRVPLGAGRRRRAQGVCGGGERRRLDAAVDGGDERDAQPARQGRARDDGAVLVAGRVRPAPVPRAAHRDAHRDDRRVVPRLRLQGAPRPRDALVVQRAGAQPVRRPAAPRRRRAARLQPRAAARAVQLLPPPHARYRRRQQRAGGHQPRPRHLRAEGAREKRGKGELDDVQGLHGRRVVGQPGRGQQLPRHRRARAVPLRLGPRRQPRRFPRDQILVDSGAAPDRPLPQVRRRRDGCVYRCRRDHHRQEGRTHVRRRETLGHALHQTERRDLHVAVPARARERARVARDPERRRPRTVPRGHGVPLRDAT